MKGDENDVFRRPPADEAREGFVGNLKWLMIIFISVFAIILQVLGSDACAATSYGEALDGYPEADFRDAPALPDDRALIVILRPKAAIDGAPFRVEMDGEPVGYVLGGAYVFAYAMPGDVRLNVNGAKLHFDTYGGFVYYVALDVTTSRGKLFTHLKVVPAPHALPHLIGPD